MADTTVNAAVHVSLHRTTNAGIGPYWSDISIGVIINIDPNDDMVFQRTTDKGVGWAETLIQTGTTRNYAVYYDKETPKDIGTLIHNIWLDEVDGNAYYRTVDVADASLGTLRTIDSSVTVDATENRNKCAITKTRSGNLIGAFSTQTEIECYRSTDSGANWTAIADVYEAGNQEDWVMLFPADTGDDDDACAIFWDRSADEISLKMWDNSVGTWTETSISGTMLDSGASLMHMDGSTRHSNGHVYLVAWNIRDDPGADLKTWDLTVDSIASPTITARADVQTNRAESNDCGMWINQQNNEVRVIYNKGGTALALTDCVYHISTDGMVSWGTEQAYSEAAADDIREISAGRTTGPSSGGRFQIAFQNDDLNDIFVNLVNDTEIVPAASLLPPHPIQRNVALRR